MDWVLAHREEFDIGTINLSFGSTPFDGLDHGYCDAEIPQYAAAVEALNAAGVVLTAAAGNEGVTNAISAPACLSGALGVGAVYPDFFTSVSWGAGGSEFCEDHSVGPDSIVCFSNSASSLALLAPGAFWNVETLGGVAEEFHGTSAAAPAVAGAAALLRQARPGLSPSAVASLLRATGRPVSDDRNGVLAPRVDVLAAIDLPDEAFGAFDGTPVALPDGTSAAVTATATISGFSGNLASVAAVVEIEHDDPRQLVATLIGPDGTRVRLHDRTGSPGAAHQRHLRTHARRRPVAQGLRGQAGERDLDARGGRRGPRCGGAHPEFRRPADGGSARRGDPACRRGSSPSRRRAGPGNEVLSVRRAGVQPGRRAQHPVALLRSAGRERRAGGPGDAHGRSRARSSPSTT